MGPESGAEVVEAGGLQVFVEVATPGRQHLHIDAEPGQAQITNGWQQFGTVTLVSHSRFAHEALWNSTRTMIALLTLVSIISGVAIIETAAQLAGIEASTLHAPAGLHDDRAD